jgi:hypothetical protein
MLSGRGHEVTPHDSFLILAPIHKRPADTFPAGSRKHIIGMRRYVFTRAESLETEWYRE